MNNIVSNEYLLAEHILLCTPRHRYKVYNRTLTTQKKSDVLRRNKVLYNKLLIVKFTYRCLFFNRITSEFIFERGACNVNRPAGISPLINCSVPLRQLLRADVPSPSPSLPRTYLLLQGGVRRVRLRLRAHRVPLRQLLRANVARAAVHRLRSSHAYHSEPLRYKHNHDKKTKNITSVSTNQRSRTSSTTGVLTTRMHYSNRR